VLPPVFKTVCGALLRRPGWVRFPSIPAKFGGPDSQDDSHSGERAWTASALRGEIARFDSFAHCSSRISAMKERRKASLKATGE
jgi:hypothetical protein